MPLVNIPPLWWYPLIYGPLLAAALVTTFIAGYKITDIGLNFKAFSVQFAVASTRFLFGVTEYFILKPSPLITKFTWQEIWLSALVLLMTTGLVEEVIFRSVLQRTAIAVFKWRGIVYVSLLFAVLHMGFLSWLDVIFVFMVALFFGWIVTKTGSLVGVTLAHGITNSILFLVAPFVF